MTNAPDDPLAAELRAIIADAEALEPLSRTRPDAFFEGKDGLVRRLRDLYADLRDGGRPPAAPPSTCPMACPTAFRAGVVARRGRIIPVDRRRAGVAP